MKAKAKLLAALIATDLSLSSGPAVRQEHYDVKLGLQPGAAASVKSGGKGGVSVGLGVGIKEGKPLQMSLWGGGGAVIGSLAGPPGAVIGAAAGVVTGLFVSVFVVPRVQPGLSDPSSRAAP